MTLHTPIAITGMACRFPGAIDPEAFWAMLCKGRCMLSADLRNDSQDSSGDNTTAAREAGFLADSNEFDPLFFGISPREAAEVDPQQRLMLEVAWEAIEDSGLLIERARGSRAGVFIGTMWNECERIGGAHPSQYTTMGQNTAMIAARISYTLGTRGPSLVVNTASSSSLVAVHLACQSIWCGECTLAIAGGVNLISDESTLGLAALGTLAVGERPRPFDERACGYMRAEGAGAIILKPLPNALADGDAIYAAILGTAANNAGACRGLAAPNAEAQRDLLCDAYRRARVKPASVSYVETHGAGTRKGDAAEADALRAVFGGKRSRRRPLLLGSVKPNIGHLEGAAGIAGLIKAALCLKYRRIPATLGFDERRKIVSLRDCALRVVTEEMPFPSYRSAAIAGVSSFGLGGTNCHVVVRAVNYGPTQEAGETRVPVGPPAERPELLVLSAHGMEAGWVRGGIDGWGW